MGLHFRIVAASSSAVWAMIVDAENRLRREAGTLPCSPAPMPTSTDGSELLSGPLVPWQELLQNGCGAALGHRCLEEEDRVQLLDNLLQDEQWYAWTFCNELAQSSLDVRIASRNGGQVVESQGQYTHAHLSWYEATFFLDPRLAIPVSPRAP